MKLQYGKRYVTKSGWITPPMFMNTPDEDFPFYAGSPDLSCGIGQHSWDVDGRYFGSARDEADIVAEYTGPVDDTEVNDDEILNAMQEIGGNFVACLALLYRRADSTNATKLKVAFSEYWSEYARHAKFLKMKNRGV